MSLLSRKNSSVGYRVGQVFLLTLLCCFTAIETAKAEDSVETTVDTITDVTDEFVGETVTITGEIDRIVSPNSLQLQEDEEFLDILNMDNILIVGIDVEANNLAQGQRIQVTGEVREFVRSEWDEDYYLTSDLELVEVLEVEYEKEPIVYADSVQILR
ncbi:hypothetical protein IQ235_14285 [Oscillatoriales cyanobacterium LEGE 11467]|uniref:Bacterial OB-fold domain-containing protein n=1 Tax=Zarconia navalis LEGE 11467 TaxID=1828826 RepID=A0A928Z9R6_9CYAN|nr:hypothetical protein [Zarconia navalis]MBE9041948.1 hypothetical protein [Zarconia navalis LEGE 11467]